MLGSGRCGVRFGRPVPMLALVLTAQDVWWGLSRRLIPRRGRDGCLARSLGALRKLVSDRVGLVVSHVIWSGQAF